MKVLILLLLEILRVPLLAIWYAQGWRMEKPLPDLNKFVILAAPHTSNWDYYHFLMLSLVARRRPNVTIKKEWVRFPIGWFIRLIGGIPIDRDHALNMVDTLANILKAQHRMVLAITPEGTRSKRPHWKSGFYYIAQAAEVPIVCGYVDYKRKCGGAGLVIEPTGNIHADFEKIKAFYAEYGMNGKYPEKINDVALKERPYDPPPSETTL